MIRADGQRERKPEENAELGAKRNHIGEPIHELGHQSGAQAYGYRTQIGIGRRSPRRKQGIKRAPPQRQVSD
jgi:hypothetical protein